MQAERYLMIAQSNSLIYSELNKEELNNWFEMKHKKFLHNIDTFYYSVKLDNDFTRLSSDVGCLQLRTFFNNIINPEDFGSIVPLSIFPDLDMQLNVRPFSFAGFYNICVECPELFDIFIAPIVPPGKEGQESVTSEIIVQIRSYLLWTYGATKAFEYSFQAVEAICNYFNLTIREVKENRADYCWHTNYIQNPESYFRIDKFAKMQVSRYKRIHYEYAFKSGDEYENDYISLGKRSDKCFVRIYLKSKEVVEKGYKPWFLREWLFNGLINRYDFFVYEETYKKQNWKYLDIARLDFYSQYGSNEEMVSLCKKIVLEEESHSDEYIHKLADELTPRVTLIVNIEYQTTRRMSKSFELKPLRDNASKGPAARIYDYIDNHALITEYLTHCTLRLVKPGADTNNSRAEYTDFWKSLRAVRMIDVKKAPKELKLTRDYTRNINKEIVKKRALSSTITYSLYLNGINDNSVIEDFSQILTMLNDNDIHTMKHIKSKRIKQLNQILISDSLANSPPERQYLLVNKSTGEII